jgi:hypothetical protein
VTEVVRVLLVLLSMMLRLLLCPHFLLRLIVLYYYPAKIAKRIGFAETTNMDMLGLGVTIVTIVAVLAVLAVLAGLLGSGQDYILEFDLAHQ